MLYKVTNFAAAEVAAFVPQKRLIAAENSCTAPSCRPSRDLQLGLADAPSREPRNFGCCARCRYW